MHFGSTVPSIPMLPGSITTSSPSWAPPRTTSLITCIYIRSLEGGMRGRIALNHSHTSLSLTHTQPRLPHRLLPSSQRIWELLTGLAMRCALQAFSVKGGTEYLVKKQGKFLDTMFGPQLNALTQREELGFTLIKKRFEITPKIDNNTFRKVVSGISFASAPVPADAPAEAKEAWAESAERLDAVRIRGKDEN